MPRKTAAPGATSKAAARSKSTAQKTAKAPAKPARPAKAAAGVKLALKAAAKAVATPKRTARKAAPPAPREAALDARPSLVRDSFTMPEQEYAVLAEVKQACLRAGIEVKKSELLRIGVALLGQLDLPTLKHVLAALPQLKTGRPPAR
jgi:hypothetical protein